MSVNRLEELVNQLTVSDEKNSNEIPDKGLDEFVSLANGADVENDEFRRKFAQSVGDLARKEKYRELLGKRNVIQSLAQFANTSSSVDVFYEVSRAVGNLCYDHPNNRKRSNDEGLVDLFMSFIQREERNLQKVVCGALANLADQTEYIQEKLSSSQETLKRLVTLCRVPSESTTTPSSSEPSTEITTTTQQQQPQQQQVVKELEVQMMAARALNNIGEQTEFVNRIIDAGAVQVLMEILHSNPKSTSPLVLIEAINALTTLCVHYEHGAAFIESGGLLELLEQLSHPDLTFDVHEAACSFIVDLSENDGLKTKITNNTAIVNKLVSGLSISDEQKKKNYTKILSNLSLSESNVQSLFKHLSTFIECLSSEDLNAKYTASTVIGNLARTDDNCVKIMETGNIVDLMLNNLSTTTDIRLQCVTLGALRNLSLLPSNKGKLIAKGIIPQLVKALDSENDHVKYASIGTIKILSTANPGVCSEFIENGLYSRLIKIASKTEEGHDPRVQYEAARIISVYASFRQFRFELLQNGGTASQVALVQSDYVVLQHEGAKALSEFAAYGQFHGEIQQSGVIRRLVQLAVSENKGDPNNPKATFLNPPQQALITLALLASTESCLDEIVAEGVVELVEKFENSTEATVVGERKNTPQLLERLRTVTKTKEERWPSTSSSSTKTDAQRERKKQEEDDDHQVLL